MEWLLLPKYIVCVSFGRISVPKLKSNWAISAFALSLNFIPILQVEKLRICKEISVRTEVTAEKLLTLHPTF